MLNTWRQGCFFHLEHSEMLVSSESVIAEMIISQKGNTMAIVKFVRWILKKLW